MNIYIVIPAHNEAAFIGKTLDSLVAQTVLPTRLVVVNDHSTDDTPLIVQQYAAKHSFITLVNTNSSEDHLPGSKVINAFHQGLDSLDDDYDIICKFDADLIFPNTYLAQMIAYFNTDPKIGMVGGGCEIEKNGQWTLENLTNKDHLRGALKAYRKNCFKAIGGLKPAMGWDTIDELLAQYHQWQIKVDTSLRVQHLKPTGNTYAKKAKYKQGEAFYRMRYGSVITTIAAIKLALLKRKPLFIIDYLVGFFKAKKAKLPYLVTKDEGVFIRALRWRKMREKIKW